MEPTAYLWTMLVESVSRGRQTMSYASLHDTESGMKEEATSIFNVKIIQVKSREALYTFDQMQEEIQSYRKAIENLPHALESSAADCTNQNVFPYIGDGG